MEDNKKKVFSGNSQIQAMGFRNALREEGITFYEQVIKDSAYVGLFEETTIYVDAEDEVEALAVLKSLKY